MKEWYTAAELADLQLEGLPATESGIARWFKRQDLAPSRCRPRSGRGGGLERHISILPDAARADLSRRALVAAPPVPPPSPVEDRSSEGSLKPWQRRVQGARSILLQEVERQSLLRGQGVSEAERFIADAAAQGDLPEDLARAAREANARLGKRTGLTARSLAEWRRAKAKGGLAALAPEAAAKPDRNRAPVWLQPFLDIYRRPGKPSIAQCYEALKFEQPDLALPSLRAVQREVQALGAVTKNRGRAGPRDLKRLRAYVVRDFSGLEPMDVISADGHTHDQEVQHPIHGRAFRPEIVSTIDIATRRCVGWSAGLAESAYVVADALRMTSVQCGVAGIFYVDNGCGFRNELLDEAALGTLARLGTTKMHSLPYNSQARGVIERFNATCWVRGARLLTAYVGRDMDKEARQIVYKSSRQDIERTGRSRFVMGWEEFTAWAQAQVDAYNARPHTSLPKIVDPETCAKRHQSPDEAWAVWRGAGWEPVTLSEREVEDLFRPYVIRTVSRGQIKLGSKTYFSAELDLGDWHGEEVMVGYDIHDASRVWVRDLDERLICTAGLDGNKVDYVPRSAIEEARDRRAKAREKRLQRHLDEVQAERGGNVIEITATRSDADAAATAAFKAEIQQIDTRKDEWAEKRARIARAQEIERRLMSNEAVSEADRAWFERYRDHPEFKAHKAVLQDFGT